MSDKKVVTIAGARPQFIKVAPISQQIRKTGGLREVLVHTGQHYDDNMSAVFFKELEIQEPDYNLGISGATHGKMTGRMLEAIEEVLLKEQPDMVVVYGDTNSTIAGALAATKIHIPIAHIEAGLRSFNKKMPEEINRILTDQCADLLFVPTEEASTNLINEGVDPARITYSGDVMYDAALQFEKAVDANAGLIANLGLTPQNYILSTIHRQENTDVPERLEAIFEGLARLNETHRVVLPLHPRTKAKVEAQGLWDLASQLQLVEPVGYLDMLTFEKNARAVVTDSGGVQKEAYFQRVPCVTLRDETEWVELVESGWNTLVSPTSSEAVLSGVTEAIASKGQDVELYGGGQASAVIVDRIADYLS